VGLAVQLLMNALQISSVYVLFALGVTVIFGVMRMVNFAHGEFFSLAGLTVAVLSPPIAVATGMPPALAYLAAFLVAFVVVLALALVVFHLALERFLEDDVAALTASLGLSLALQGIYVKIFGSDFHGLQPFIPGTLRIAGGAIAYQVLAISLAAILSTCGLLALTKFTRLGKALRAVSEDREAAMLQGIRQRRISAAGFLLGAALAALAGGFIAPMTVLQPAVGGDFMLKAFIIIVLGGLGSIPGTILGGCLVGVVESLAGYYFDLVTASILLFLFVIAMLLFRPKGLWAHAG
jgi:branched-chain amino acid transport system permease protein